ncbi:hypothetical protein ACFQV2_00605 [Actinokineospora soli]|uniref:Uncharacterized protein n=1 Tax=Actinokineospora soli TaxID=1048753 RepID=A0ABW2TFX3_9PSEU
MTLLCEIGDLMAARPNPVAPPDVVADWFDRKASVLDAIAADDLTTTAQSATAPRVRRARPRRAQELRQGDHHDQEHDPRRKRSWWDGSVTGVRAEVAQGAGAAPVVRLRELPDLPGDQEAGKR